jgi:hypothetical protein
MAGADVICLVQELAAVSAMAPAPARGFSWRAGQRHRPGLQEWALSTGTWETLVSDLPPIPGPIHPVIDDRKRQDTSIFVWTQVTCGEHLFAPRPIEAAQPPHIQREWAQRREDHMVPAHPPRPTPALR